MCGLLFATATALSMALVSTAFGYALVHSRAPRRLERFVPAIGLAGMVFGTWYTVDVLHAVKLGTLPFFLQIHPAFSHSTLVRGPSRALAPPARSRSGKKRERTRGLCANAG